MVNVYALTYPPRSTKIIGLNGVLLRVRCRVSSLASAIAALGHLTILIVARFQKDQAEIIGMRSIANMQQCSAHAGELSLVVTRSMKDYEHGCNFFGRLNVVSSVASRSVSAW